MILHSYKIVFAGSMGAGKTAAIQTLSDIPVFQTEAVNTDIDAHSKMFTTVGIDYGELTLDDGTKIGLYGTPGQQRFDFIWSTISKGALGTIILIDHTTENPIQDLQFYYDCFSQTSNNLIFAITHLDQKAATKTIEYHQWLEQQAQCYPLFFIDARNTNDVLLLIDTLLAQSEVSLSLMDLNKNA